MKRRYLVLALIGLALALIARGRDRAGDAERAAGRTGRVPVAALHGRDAVIDAGAGAVARGGAELTGRIADPRGEPIAHARVRVSETTWWFGAVAATVETDADGRYVARVRAGTVAVLAGADGYTTARIDGRAPGALDVQLLPEATLGGIVIDGAGAPVAGARVQVAIVDPSARSTLDDEIVTTGDDGRFRIGHLDPGRYTATARTAHGYGELPGSVPLALGAHVDDAVVRLAPAHQVVGRIVVEPERATCPAEAHASLYDDARGRGISGEAQPDGTLRFDGVPPGLYLVMAECTGFVARPATGYPRVAVSERDMTGLEWPVARGAEIAGRVLVGGGPVGDVRVTAHRIAVAPRDASYYTVADTTVAGEFHLTGLAPGRYKVSAGLPGAFGSLDLDAEVEVAAAVVHHDLVLERALGSVRGRVAIHGELGPAYVQLATPSEGATVALDAAGGFRFAYVAAGTYTIHVENRWTRVGEDRELTVEAGRETALELAVDAPAGTITGRVLDAHRAPVGDAFVTVGPEDRGNNPRDSARQDSAPALVYPDGTFSIGGLAEGSYTVRASRRTGGEVFAAHVAPGAAVELALVATGGVAGTVRGGGRDLIVTARELPSHAMVREERFAGDHFEVRELPAGSYVIDVSDGRARRAVAVEVAEGATSPVEVALSSTATVVGRTVDARTGAPVAWLQMSAQARDTGAGYVSATDRNITEADGRFELDGVPRGAVAIDGWSRATEGIQSVATAYRTIPDTGAVVDLGDIPVFTMPPGGATGSLGFDIVPIDPDARIAKVGWVTADSAAARAGLVEGDVIESIDGLDVTGANTDRAPALLPGPAGAQRTLVLRRGDTLRFAIGP